MNPSLFFLFFFFGAPVRIVTFRTSPKRVTQNETLPAHNKRSNYSPEHANAGKGLNEVSSSS